MTSECDFPAEARTRTIVSASAMPEGLAQGTRLADDVEEPAALLHG